MSNGGLRDGTDVRRLARQTGKEREVDICPFNSASFWYVSCLVLSHVARNHICVLIDGHLPVTLFKMDIYNDTYLWLCVCVCVKSKPCGYVCVYVCVDWWFRSFFLFSFLSHETAAEPMPALPTNPQPQTVGDESDPGVNDFTSVSETVAVQSSWRGKKQSVGWICICSCMLK